ncbi:MAG: nucleoside-diphosphate kinase [Nanoarchaeota archaeon]|nr:nucleoside-diphosphate kinase [Nanoarchaeota archaeon]
MGKEQSLVVVKPDAMQKGLMGTIMDKFAEAGLEIVAAKVIEVTQELAQEHYQHLKEEKFFDELIKYITGSYHTKNVLALVYQKDNACNKIRDIIGATNPEEAKPTSLRGKYGRITTKGVFENVVHASESVEEAEREIKLWFRPNELTETNFPTQVEKTERQEVFWK